MTKMIFTTVQTETFFQKATQMAIPSIIVTQIAIEGIATVNNLEDFGKDELDQVVSNLQHPPGGVVALTFGAKSQKRFFVATKLVKYNDMVRRRQIAGNIQWNSVMCDFGEQWKAREERKKKKAILKRQKSQKNSL
uniref:Uncharacterized protein n=1 Tax=Corethron hystrix TaxID=216773 RepID=A0A6U5HN96_9STRA|mmetsp:Transcript_31040/g.71021  ORF Transcript_31040/g.71021 Transcript_31040/m.71021 type:complete len:136 (+) Transcript_31040:92-499(+)